jgi:hypothetical protein
MLIMLAAGVINTIATIKFRFNKWVAGLLGLLVVASSIIWVIFKPASHASGNSNSLGVAPEATPERMLALGLVAGLITFGGAYTGLLAFPLPARDLPLVDKKTDGHPIFFFF